jgi:hypothetical protein
MDRPGAAASPAAETATDETTEVVTIEGQVTEVADANPADPSPADAEDAKQPASLLDVVKSAVEPVAEPEAPSSPQGTESPDAEEPVDKAGNEADDANLPFHNHPRWQALLAERDELREPAKRMGLIEDFMRDKGLSADEVAEGYEIMGLLKGGPEDLARTWFAERLGALDEALGNVLPDDLRQRVDEGLLDPDGAAELAQARAQTALRERQETERTAADARRTAEQDATAKTTAMATAVTAWEAKIKASDPDYPKKAKLIEDRCGSIVRADGKAPTTPEEATALVERAHREITDEMKAVAPKPRPITPAPAGSSTTAAPEPKTLREAINAAVGR